MQAQMQGPNAAYGQFRPPKSQYPANWLTKSLRTANTQPALCDWGGRVAMAREGGSWLSDMYNVLGVSDLL